MTNQKLLKSLSEANGVSGYEHNIAKIIKKAFNSYCDEIKMDKMGNLMAIKRSRNIDNPPKIMLAAHMDEIGLMVTKIDKNGFIRFTNVGGIDSRTLLAQEVIIHGKEEVSGIIGAKPPHLSTKEEREKAVPMEELFIDPGMQKAEIEKLVSVGDLVTINRSFMPLHNDFVSGKSLDDRAGIIMLYQTLKELKYLKNNVDVYAVATVQEEVGTRGAITSSFAIHPNIGIAIDVCHGIMPGVDEEDAVEMDKGPAIGFGPHVHPKIFKKLKEVAEEIGLEYQIEASPYPGGTDAWAIQIARSGVASGLISIPLRYMHTSVETLSLNDVKKGGQLLAQFIARLDSDFVEGLTCY